MNFALSSNPSNRIAIYTTLSYSVNYPRALAIELLLLELWVFFTREALVPIRFCKEDKMANLCIYQFMRGIIQPNISGHMKGLLQILVIALKYE